MNMVKETVDLGLLLKSNLHEDVFYDLRTTKAFKNPSSAIILSDMINHYEECCRRKTFYEHKGLTWFSYTPLMCSRKTGVTRYQHTMALNTLQEMGVVEYCIFGMPKIHLVRFLLSGLQENFPYLCERNG